MNKKFLSAILFGALMVTSTGTFVSCKDYDDDIENLQTQIDKNSSAIAELQKLVGQGKWVSSISSIENGFTVTMSDGSSVQIKGINGKDGVNGQDGKNGAEWTIGADGFWYVDGEKTENVAVGKNGENGKNGVSAPSPFIGTDGNWVVYAWDAEKGEFVEKATEIPAAGVAAYAVEADGVYTLHIADENGEYQEIVLPATCDSFVVSSPAKGEIMVSVDVATWGSEGRVKAEYDKLVAAFPEIANIKKGDNMTQDGGLPLVVSPSELALDDSFEFALVGMNGKVADIELSNPVEGISNDWSYNNQGIMTRSANAEACLWTLDVTPAYDKNKKTVNYGYAQASNAALVVTNAKGLSSRTSFVYSVTANSVSGKPSIFNRISEVEYSEAIDVLAPIYGAQENTAIFTLEKEYFGKFVLEATKKSEIEKYDITIDGSNLMIGNMPVNETSITVDLRMTVLGLCGSTNYNEVTLKITQPISAIELPAKEVTLDAKKQEVRWDVKEDLGLSAVDFIKFYNSTPKFVVSREDEDGNTQKAYEAAIKFYNAKGTEVSFNTSTEKWNGGDAVTFGFDVKADTKGTGATEMWMPETYKVTLIAQEANSTTRLFTAETELEVSNPEVAISLVPEFTVENVLHVVGTASRFTATDNGNYQITYNLNNGLKYDSKVILGNDPFSFKDVDFEEYKEAYDATSAEDEDLYNAEEMASLNWISGDNLVVYSYNEEDAEEAPAKNDMLGKVRNIEATFVLFGNAKNEVKFPFQILVKSAVYSETPADVVTVDATKLALHLTDDPATTGEGKNETTVDLAKITEAALAYGPQAGAVYNLWDTQYKPSQNKTKEVTDYSKPENDGTYLLNSKEQAIEISKDYYANLGFTASQILALPKDVKFHFTVNASEYVINEGTWVNGNFGRPGHWEGRVTVTLPSWNDIKEAVYTHYAYVNGTWKQTSKSENISEEDQKLIELFNAYMSQMVFNEKTTVAYTVDQVNPSDYLRANSVVKYEDEVGKKFVTVSGTTLTASLSAGTVMTAETVEVKMYIEIYDKWGMTMKVPFTVKVSE